MVFVGRDLDKSKLPTVRDVMQYLLFLRDEKLQKLRACSIALSDFFTPAANAIVELWRRTHIPIISLAAIRKKCEKLVTRYRLIEKNSANFKSTAWDKLFAVCHCNCGIQNGLVCKCASHKKIPMNSQAFFIDQCGPRQLTLDSIDEAGAVGGDVGDVEMEERENIPTQREPLSLNPQPMDLTSFIRSIDACGKSDEVAEILAVALFKSLKASGVSIDVKIDLDLIASERVRVREADSKTYSRHDLLKGIFIDDRVDSTKKQFVVAGLTRVSLEKETHITMVKEPGSRYIDYVASNQRNGAAIATAMKDHLTAQGYSLKRLIAFGCKASPIYTDKQVGVIAKLEKHLAQPLHWFVCLFSFNDFALNGVFKAMDGESIGSKPFSGPIGREILNCENVPVVENFNRIEMGELPENIEGWQLSDDQKYLYGMARAIHNGVCGEQLASYMPGPVTQSDWLPNAARILRLYTTKQSASEELKHLVSFVVKVYVPFWFLVKGQPQAVQGSRHMFKYIQWMRELPMFVQKPVRDYIQTNGVYCHSENILLSMITDANKDIRNEGYEKIMHARSEPADPPVRRFVMPKVNFDCTSYPAMIEWKYDNDDDVITQPPCVQFHWMDDLRKFIGSDEIIDVPEFLCHSQNTQRFVRLVSEKCNNLIEKNCREAILSELAPEDKYINHKE